jgi:hypothetical protein
MPPKPVCQYPEKECADGPPRECEKNCFRDGGNLGVKFIRHGADTKNENEEIKRVERPAQKASEEGVALNGSKPPNMTEEPPARFQQLIFAG